MFSTSVISRHVRALTTRAIEAALIVAIIVGAMLAFGLATGNSPAGADSVFAARGGRTDVTVTFEPGSSSVGATYVIAGSGFKANSFVSIGARYADVTWWASGPTDSQGRFSLTLKATTAGAIVHDVYEKARSGYRLKTSVTLQVAG